MTTSKTDGLAITWREALTAAAIGGRLHSWNQQKSSCRRAIAAEHKNVRAHAGSCGRPVLFRSQAGSQRHKRRKARSSTFTHPSNRRGQKLATLPRARVDVWHADGLGLYSGYADQETGSTKGETFYVGRNLPGRAERCVSSLSIPAGIQGAHPTFTSRSLSRTKASLLVSSTSLILLLSTSTRRCRPIASGNRSDTPRHACMVAWLKVSTSY
jgi:hypothetical protein